MGKSSKYRGVTLFRPTGKWRAQISAGGKTTSLGDHDTEEEAARAFDRAAINKAGMNAKTNFIVMEYAAEYEQLTTMDQAELVQMLRSRARKSGMQTSNFRGVSLLKQTRKWHAQINVNGKQVHLGFFPSEEQAARAYDRAAINKGARERSKIITNFSIDDYAQEMGILASIRQDELVQALSSEQKRKSVMDMLAEGKTDRANEIFERIIDITISDEDLARLKATAERAVPKLQHLEKWALPPGSAGAAPVNVPSEALNQFSSGASAAAAAAAAAAAVGGPAAAAAAAAAHGALQPVPAKSLTAGLGAPMQSSAVALTETPHAQQLMEAVASAVSLKPTSAAAAHAARQSQAAKASEGRGRRTDKSPFRSPKQKAVAASAAAAERPDAAGAAKGTATAPSAQTRPRARAARGPGFARPSGSKPDSSGEDDIARDVADTLAAGLSRPRGSRGVARDLAAADDGADNSGDRGAGAVSGPDDEGGAASKNGSKLEPARRSARAAARRKRDFDSASDDEGRKRPNKRNLCSTHKGAGAGVHEVHFKVPTKARSSSYSRSRNVCPPPARVDRSTGVIQESPWTPSLLALDIFTADLDQVKAAAQARSRDSVRAMLSPPPLRARGSVPSRKLAPHCMVRIGPGHSRIQSPAVQNDHDADNRPKGSDTTPRTPVTRRKDVNGSPGGVLVSPQGSNRRMKKAPQRAAT